jgi:hypothetical protein
MELLQPYRPDPLALEVERNGLPRDGKGVRLRGRRSIYNTKKIQAPQRLITKSFHSRSTNRSTWNAPHFHV